jgi:hypothetical protein
VLFAEGALGVVAEGVAEAVLGRLVTSELACELAEVDEPTDEATTEALGAAVEVAMTLGAAGLEDAVAPALWSCALGSCARGSGTALALSCECSAVSHAPRAAPAARGRSTFRMVR